MSTTATKCGVLPGDSLKVIVRKIKAHVDGIMPAEPLAYRADQALMALDAIVATDGIATISAAHKAFAEHYGEGAPAALSRAK